MAPTSDPTQAGKIEFTLEYAYNLTSKTDPTSCGCMLCWQGTPITLYVEYVFDCSVDSTIISESIPTITVL